MSKSTPGPWTWFGGNSLWNDDLEIAILGCASYSLASDVVSEGDEGDTYWVPSEANARLIAAAPCLLAALAGYVEFFSRYQNTGTEFQQVRAAGLAAIEKATGETQ